MRNQDCSISQKTRESFFLNLPETLFFLAPLSGAFFLLGAPGFRFYQILIPPSFLAFFVLFLFSFLIVNKSWFLSLKSTPGIPLFWTGIGLVFFSTFFVKQFSQAELKELKNIIFPLIFSFTILSRFMRTPSHVKKVFTFVGFGIIGSMLFLYLRMGPAFFKVRGIRGIEFEETTGLTFIWFGISGATLLALGLVYARGFFPKAIPSFLFLFFGGVAIFASGTRAAFVGAILFLLTLPLQKILPHKIVIPFFFVGILGICLLSVFPSLMLDILPPPSFSALIQGPEEANRFTNSSGYLQDLAARFTWWNLIITKDVFKGALFGMDYQSAIYRSLVLAHPHNIFIWGRIMGGLPVAFLFSLAFFRFFCRSFKISTREPKKEIRNLARVNLFLYAVLFLVFVTNSWAGGTYLIFAINMALSVALNSWVGQYHGLKNPLCQHL